jgi:hypothetical protein
MDNLAAHNVAGVRQAMADDGIRSGGLSTISPDFITMMRLRRSANSLSPRPVPSRRTSAQAPTSVFAKFATSDAARRKASQTIGLYQREVNFYNVLAKGANVRAPACYFAKTTSDGEFFALILEDFPNRHAPFAVCRRGWSSSP